MYGENIVFTEKSGIIALKMYRLNIIINIISCGRLCFFVMQKSHFLGTLSCFIGVKTPGENIFFHFLP